MTTSSSARTGADIEAIPEPARIIGEMRASIMEGEHWFMALMAAVRNWPLPVEEVRGRLYRYLVGGEAFDWLLLAERLCEEVDDLVPQEEAEALLFEGRCPIEPGELDMEKLLGAKHKAHLNFVYGVRVEEALQLAVQGEVHKERFSTSIWENGHFEDEVFNRIYGAPRDSLVAQFRAEKGLPQGDTFSLAELSELTYWLFKHRMKNNDPERVASDTRKGLAQLQRLDACRAARHRAASPEL